MISLFIFAVITFYIPFSHEKKYDMLLELVVIDLMWLINSSS